SHAEQMETLQESVRKVIAQKDQRYQSDINSMKSVHKKQLTNQHEESARREEISQSMVKSDKDQAVVQMQARLDKLNSDYEVALKQKDELFSKQMVANREAQSQ